DVGSFVCFDGVDVPTDSNMDYGLDVMVRNFGVGFVLLSLPFSGKAINYGFVITLYILDVWVKLVYLKLPTNESFSTVVFL
ncbi:hypothetical protein Tco_0253426, partial [Tanacetum coccineum]